MVQVKMLYPLEERIGQVELFVERRAETIEYEQWLSRTPKKLSRSRAIFARKKRALEACHLKRWKPVT